MASICDVKLCAYKNVDKNDKCLLDRIYHDENAKCRNNNSDYTNIDYNKLNTVVHVNIGQANGLYCRMENKIIKSLDKCIACPLGAGAAQGHGAECRWEDIFQEQCLHFYDPKAELLRVTHLIDNGVLNRYPDLSRICSHTTIEETEGAVHMRNIIYADKEDEAKE